ncbi:phenylpropionate dioxygenase [Pusillimonas caeni]|uniref:aromatic-ring-hydroxylating dioxygenase subunit beta n=1 Tax=Pusillimonas caeni TaxID=1348472 RepID=UPI000E5992C1|nr:aromatic-ring-hydroxylating dioxygenase subunit beta [Pusillimonas caeni]TFL15714.1 phenylpropionate dioxygenase [Pusillimonas caeni]
MSAITDQQLVDFVYAEARMLDEQQFEAWLELFTEDGYYWMPLAHGQTDPRLHASLLYEDKLLLRVRVERLAGQRTFSQQPKSRSHHLLARPEIETGHEWHAPDRGQYVVRTAFHYVEARQDQQTLFAGWSVHQLIAAEDGLRIKQKRVDLVNCDSAMRSIQLLM